MIKMLDFRKVFNYNLKVVFGLNLYLPSGGKIYESCKKINSCFYRNSNDILLRGMQQ